jgi:2-polyprenyl-3-methyl-5-hydroxy-6-metoxy-1,4-benzoquinol methylase
MARDLGFGRRLLVAIASYGGTGDKYLARLIDEYRSMSFDTHIVVLSNVQKSLPHGVELRIGLPTRNPWSLPWAHKKVLAERVNDYDLFIYSEDDTLITQRNIEAFLSVSEELTAAEIPGFMRYENGPNGARNYINLHGHYHWDSDSVCRRGPYTLAFLTNEHSACYLLTRKQLQRALDSGCYLVPPHQGKYDLACTASTDPYTACGFRKLICISHLEDFLVHHLPDKYTGPEFKPSEQGFDKQLRALMTRRSNGAKPVSLLETETKLPAAMYSKQYDEAVREEVFNFLTPSVHRVLSVGSGWGKAERWLAQKGVRVTTLPLDPVVGACLEGGGIKVLYGDLSSARKKLEGSTFDCLFFSNVLHLVRSPEAILRRYAELLDPGGYILVVTPHVATARNKLYGLLKKPGYRELRYFDQSGVQFVAAESVRKWFAPAGIEIESVQWTAPRRFKSMMRFGRGFFGPMFAAEMVILGKKIHCELRGPGRLDASNASAL